MTKTQSELLLRQQEIVKLIDFFISCDNNDDKQVNLQAPFKELEVGARKWNMIP